MFSIVTTKQWISVRECSTTVIPQVDVIKLYSYQAQSIYMGVLQTGGVKLLHDTVQYLPLRDHTNCYNSWNYIVYRVSQLWCWQESYGFSELPNLCNRIAGILELTTNVLRNSGTLGCTTSKQTVASCMGDCYTLEKISIRHWEYYYCNSTISIC